MYAYLNVYTNFPWEIKYGGKFDVFVEVVVNVNVNVK